MNTLTVLKKSDQVSIVFGEWFDKTYGNTCFDATVTVNNETFNLAYRYGYHVGSKQAIDEVLKECGYRVRTVKNNPHGPYNRIHQYNVTKLKRELHK